MNSSEVGRSSWSATTVNVPSPLTRTRAPVFGSAGEGRTGHGEYRQLRRLFGGDRSRSCEVRSDKRKQRPIHEPGRCALMPGQREQVPIVREKTIRKHSVTALVRAFLARNKARVDELGAQA